MNEKIERAALLNRLRVQKHREKKRLKLETGPEQTGEGSTLSQKEVERSSINGHENQYPSPPVDNPATGELQNDGTNQANESCPGGIPIFGTLSSGPHMSDSDSAVSDGENNSNEEAVPECSDNNISQKQDLIGGLRVWASKGVTYSKSDALWRILKPVHPEIPLSTKTLLKTDLQLHNEIRKFNVSNPLDTSEYAHFGIALHLIKIVNVELHPDLILWLIINVDGMSPYKSSPLNFWPILGLVYHPLATYKPFVISAYYGKGKPYSVDVYMEDFITEMNHLLEHGIVIQEKKFEVRIKCFCCDRPARAYLKRIVNHGAYFACERCWVSGIQYLGRTIYPLRDCEQRTEESFRNQENPEHHDGVSPLLKLRDKNKKPLNLVKLFIQEFMHAGSLGIMKKLMCDQWFSNDSKLTREKKLRASLRLVNLVGQIPVELQRTTRELSDLSLWKAKEFRLVLLYIGPFVLKDILSKEEYDHFLLLFSGSRIMCCRYLIQKFGEHAKLYLDRFVLLCELIYGLEFVVLNPHILSHLYEDVVNMGCPISEVDAFIFEGYLSELKRALRSGNRPLAQLCKKVETDLELNNTKVVSKMNLLVLDHKKFENLYHVSKLKYQGFEFTIKKPDNVVMMKDGSLLEIKDMICSSLKVDASKLYILGEKLEIIGSAFDYPIPSTALQIFSVKRNQPCEIFKFPLNEVSCKVMLCEIYELSCDEKQLFSVPILRMAAS